MQLKVSNILLGFGVVLLAIVSAVGQQSPSPEETEINQLRSEIRLLTAKPPQSEARLGDYRRTLLDLRVRLAALLNQQVGALNKDIRDLKVPNSTATLRGYVQKLEGDLQKIEVEIKELASALVPNSQAEAPAAQVTPPKTRSRRIDTPLPSDKNGRRYGQEGFTGEPVSWDVTNADFRDILNYLDEEYGLNFALDSSVLAAISVTNRVKDVPWNVALDPILKANGLGITVTGNVMRVAKIEVLTQEGETKTATKLVLAKEAEKLADFEANVKSFTDEKLKAAAAPVALMEDKNPQVNCVTLVNDPNPPRFPKYDQSLCFLAKRISNDKAGNPAEGIDLQQDKGTLLTILIAKLLKTQGSESLVSFITEAQESRTDQQVGAGPSSSGTTSLVSKGGVPYALGFAVENGAAIQTRSGTIATFRINPAGTLNLFSKKGFITGFQETEDDPVLKFLRKTSIGLSFDTSRGSDPSTFVGDRQQLSALSFRYEFVNERDPRHKKYEAEWERLTRTAGEEFAKTTWATTSALQSFGLQGQLIPKLKDPALQAWLDQTNEKLATAGSDIDAIASIIRSQADLVPAEAVTPETVEAITNFAIGFQTYEAAKSRLLDKIAKGKILTFEYINNREVNAADTSNLNFIAATGVGSRISLTANGSLTLFNKRPDATITTPRPGRIRDFQFAGEVLIPLKVGVDFWFSGRYERLLEAATTFAGITMPGTTGDIAVGQFGLNIPIKSLGIKFPVLVTFSNRTELIKEKEIRGNFGFTFNWDTLFSKLKPF